jgi:hypothetical protein
MSLLRLLNVQGIVGIAVSAILAALLGLQATHTRHWHKQSDRFEHLYDAEKIAHQQTVINYREAAETARKADAANKVRAEREQATINAEREQSYEARIADARARADRVRQQASPAPGHPGSPGAAPVPGVPGAPGGPGAATPKGGLSPDDRLIATEQAIQLDELIQWVKSQGRIDLQGNSQSSLSGNR